MTTRLVILVIGYLLGNIQTGYLLGRTRHMDIRQFGSGNSGATNTLRVLGKKAGAIVFFGDFFKAFLPCLFVRILFFGGMGYLYMLYMGLGVVLGHNFPFYLGFRGGKGVASTAGVILALDFRIALACLVVFLLVVIATRYVSLGSMAVMIAFMVLGNYYLSLSYSIRYLSILKQLEFRLLLLFMGCLSIFMHRANIKRLLSGTESKLGSKSS